MDAARGYFNIFSAYTNSGIILGYHTPRISGSLK